MFNISLGSTEGLPSVELCAEGVAALRDELNAEVEEAGEEEEEEVGEAARWSFLSAKIAFEINTTGSVLVVLREACSSLRAI